MGGPPRPGAHAGRPPGAARRAAAQAGEGVETTGRARRRTDAGRDAHVPAEPPPVGPDPGRSPEPGVRSRSRPPEGAARRRRRGEEGSRRSRVRRGGRAAAQLGSRRVSVPAPRQGAQPPAGGMQPPARRARRLALPALLALLTCSVGK